MAISTKYPYTCRNCSHTEHRIGTDPPTICPKCGENSWQAAVEGRAGFRGEFEAIARRADGEIFAERTDKADQITKATLAADSGQPSRITVNRTARVRTFEDEGVAVESLAKAINLSRGTSYVVEPKAAEDSDYADRILVSPRDAPPRIDIQVRNLDDQMIAGLGKQGQFANAITCAQRIAQIEAAIADKANVDPGQKAKTILLLHLPAPLGKLAKQEITQHAFEKRGFKEIWLAPFREDCFQLS